MGNRIEPLAEHVIAQISSTKEIRDFRTVVLGLLENSLDAAASKVVISIDLSKRSCTVEDNGHGIATQEFEPQGGLCRRHYTSKALLGPLKHHSSDGIFLHSLAALSLLCITSKAANEVSQAHLCLHQGQVLLRGVRVPPVHQLTAFSHHGTRVFVDDAFGTLPVRVKQFALQFEDSKARARCFDDIRSSIVELLLAWPQPCMVRLEDELYAERRTTLTASHPSISREITARALHELTSIPPFTLQDKLSLLFQAGLAPEETRQHWIAASASSSRFKLKGMICSVPSPSARCQFLSIGVTPLTNESNLSELYSVINELFNKSTFGMEENAQGKKQKGVDRWPMFIINIVVLDQPSKHIMLEKLSRLLGQVVSQWLAAQGYRVRNLRRSRSQMQESPSALSPTPSQDRNERARTVPIMDASPTAGGIDLPWTRIKSLRALTTAGGVPRENTPEVIAPLTHGDTGPTELVQIDASTEEWSPWQDPSTRRNYLVNKRTGMTMPVPVTDARSIDTPVQPLPSVLRDWQPDVFTAPSELSIPKIATLPIDELRSLSNTYGESVRATRKITRDQLKNATVISQVDQKFILCSMPASNGPESDIVLLDQHAASERVILENLLTSLCSDTQGVQLEAPIIFETTLYESKLFRAHSQSLSRWGIAYDVTAAMLPITASQVRPAQTQHRIVVKRLPAVIAERCRSTPQLLIELLRAEVWKQDAARNAASLDTVPPPAAASTAATWPSRLGNCPKGLLDIVNSRACRSAVMFNDVLSPQQCQELDKHRAAATTGAHADETASGLHFTRGR